MIEYNLLSIFFHLLEHAQIYMLHALYLQMGSHCMLLLELHTKLFLQDGSKCCCFVYLHLKIFIFHYLCVSQIVGHDPQGGFISTKRNMVIIIFWGCSMSFFSWNEWLKLPMKYQDLPRNAQVYIWILALKLSNLY